MEFESGTNSLEIVPVDKVNTSAGQRLADWSSMTTWSVPQPWTPPRFCSNFSFSLFKLNRVDAFTKFFDIVFFDLTAELVADVASDTGIFLPVAAISPFHPGRAYLSGKMSAQNGTSPPRKYVTLVSKEGFEFVVLREATLVSPAIRSMLDPERNFLEAQSGRCVFHDIRYVLKHRDCHPSACAWLWTFHDETTNIRCVLAEKPDRREWFLDSVTAIYT
jgi:hypothetical protein